MSFPNCRFDWSIAKHVRQRLFLHIQVIIFVRCTATAWRHRRSSAVTSNKETILHDSPCSLQHPWKTCIFSSWEVEKKTLKTSPAVLQCSQPSPVFQNSARLFIQLAHLHGLLQHMLGTPFSAFADFLQKSICR